MLSEVVAGIDLISFDHKPVPGHFGYVGGSGDRVAATISFDDSIVSVWAFSHVDEVQKQVSRLQRKLPHGQEHGGQSRVSDAHLIDVFGTYHPNPNR